MASGSIVFSSDRRSLIISSKYDPDLIADIKALKHERRRYNPTEKTWVVAVEEAGRVKEIAEEYGLSFPSDILKAQEEKAEQRAALEAASRAQDLPEELNIPGITANLRAYQKAGIAYMIAAPRSIQGDDMGLGKTLQSLATIEATNAYPALVISPSSLTLNWKAEAATWLPGRKVQVLKTGDTPFDKAADITIVSYDIAKKRGVELSKAGFKSVIADEAHYLKNAKAKRTEMVGAVVKDIPRAHLLTGTPVTNRPADLIAPLKMLGHLDDEFGGWETFARRYCNAHKGNFGWDLSGASNLSELNSKLRATCLVRRIKKDVLTELPEKQRSYQPVELSNRAEYNRTHQALLSALNEPREEGEAGSQGNILTLMNQLKQLVGAGKIEAAKESIQGYIDADKKVCVFAHHHEVLNGIEAFLKEEGIGYVRIDGTTATDDRQANKDRFQTNPSCKVFLASTKAAGVGLTLTAASDVLILEQEWVPADVDQAEDRTHRLGQLNSVNCVHLIAEDSFDSKLLEVVERKRGIAEQAITGDASTVEVTPARNRSVFHEVLQKYAAEAKASNLGKKRSNGHKVEKGTDIEHRVRLDDSNPDERMAFMNAMDEASRRDREKREREASSIQRSGGIKI